MAKATKSDIKNKNYSDWARHFGKSTLDPEVIAEFKTAGVKKPPVIKRDEFEACENIGEMTVNVGAPILFGQDGKFGDGVGILSRIAIHLRDSKGQMYFGDLPFSIDHNDTRKTLRKKLGKPDNSDNEEHWDEWNIEELNVTAHYSDNNEEFLTLVVGVPEEE